MIFMLLAPLASLAAVALPQPCVVTDGDSLRCGSERVRLLAIDAPETAGFCRIGRRCAPGDPLRSKLALEQATMGKRLSIRRVGHDRYGRTLAIVYANGRNTSCTMLAGGYAIYRKDWDNGGLVRADCPTLAQ